MSTQADLFQSLRLRRDHLHEQIADSIQDVITNNQLQPGTRLPSERDLAKMLGVNRATVREAIRSLQQRGLVEMRTGSGTFVTDMLGAVVAESIERYSVFGSCSHEELITFREILEPEMAALAATYATPEDLAQLEELVDEIEETFTKDDIASYTDADISFHAMLGVASHNELITAVFSGLEKVMRIWIQAQSETHRLEEGAWSHRQVYEGIVARDPDRAREAMRFHMRTTRMALLDQPRDLTSTEEETEG